ncbi:LrgB family protein [Apibacter muscae]|uniref:LrgB family protein n=2 Tax=Apibacter muscae TaxID=2509004 RepID=A0A563DKW2_9FLAO|nr:LrgB family protein [Apibacter muscae]TWP31427.1 LrgB family protein [Apibacter muscae]
MVNDYSLYFYQHFYSFIRSCPNNKQEKMNELLNTPLFHILITLIVFGLSNLLYNQFKYKILHPGIISILSLIIYLKISETSFENYNKNTYLISFWLGPSVVALGLPLYLYIKHLKGSYLRVLLAMLAGSILGIVSVVIISKLLGASDVIAYSLSPKSVTTPIAMEISKSLGGIPSLTIAIVFITGFTGALFGWSFLQFLGIKDQKAIGIAMGTAAHAIGTAEVVKKGQEFGAYGAIGIALNGIFTAIFAPLIIPPLLHLLNFL